MATCKTTVQGLIHASSLTWRVSFPLLCHPEWKRYNSGKAEMSGWKRYNSGKTGSTSFFTSLSLLFLLFLKYFLLWFSTHSPQVGSEGLKSCQHSPPVRNLCKRPAATQRDVTDGRIDVPSADGSPTWRGVRELEAELWKRFLACFRFSY